MHYRKPVSRTILSPALLLDSMTFMPKFETIQNNDLANEVTATEAKRLETELVKDIIDEAACLFTTLSNSVDRLLLNALTPQPDYKAIFRP